VGRRALDATVMGSDEVIRVDVQQTLSPVLTFFSQRHSSNAS
jgi:hypothetical protein